MLIYPDLEAADAQNKGEDFQTGLQSVWKRTVVLNQNLPACVRFQEFYCGRTFEKTPPRRLSGFYTGFNLE